MENSLVLTELFFIEGIIYFIFLWFRSTLPLWLGVLGLIF